MATMKDVSRVAGVSIITVSRVINTPEKVKESTRIKVQEVMDQLGFQPNHNAKALVTNKTRTVHLLYPKISDTSDPFFMKLIAGVSKELSENYYSFLFRSDWDFPYKCDGVIAMGLETGEDILLKEKLNVPCVLFGKTDYVDWVNVDDVLGAYKMVTYILKMGHKEVGMLVLNDKEPFAKERLEGYFQALKNHDVEINPKLIRYVTFSEKDGYEKTLELLNETNITAVFCSTDLLALGAIRAARELNKRIPEDFSIGGYDGVWLDQISDPQLTTIKTPVFEIGKALARKLIEKIENPNKQKEKVLYEPELIIRKSICKLNK